jgi:hypothetical protein
MEAILTSLTEFVGRAFTMPTTVWSVLLILVGAYWILSLLSGVDFEGADALDSLDHLDGVDGLDVLDAGDHLDLIDHVDAVDHVDALDGMDGADALDSAEALDSADGLEGHDLGGAASHSLFGWLGFHEVPKTFSLSLVVGFGWLVSYFGTAWLVDVGKWAAFGLSTVLLLGLASLTAAIGLTAVALIPLRRMLVLRVGAARIDLLGETCVVKTGRVDERFGQAETRGGHLVQVRARDGRAYKYGESAVIFDYNREHEVFYIAPLDAALVGTVDNRIPARSPE